MKLDNAKAPVTGGSEGIGRGIAAAALIASCRCSQRTRSDRGLVCRIAGTAAT